jgi:redox-sensitive bicupin YhaK (pirin superfamily)
MSGPVTQQDTNAATVPEEPSSRPLLEITPARAAEVGGVGVRRALPRKTRRTVGAWCFADHFGPVPPDGDAPMIGPHPHIGLQTVTWLLAGALVHTDSLGSEQHVRPGQLNLMTAGKGVAHAEEAHVAPGMHGVQFWVAQPESTRFSPPAFEHHPELPRLEIGNADVTVINGSFAGFVSPARTDTPLVGAELALRSGDTTIPLQPHFEHALIVLDGAVQIDGTQVAPGFLAYLGSERDELLLRASAAATVLLIGGEPLESPVLMWWNFVARTRDEIDSAYRDWEQRSERFGTVRSDLERIPAPPPIWMAGG